MFHKTIFTEDFGRCFEVFVCRVDGGFWGISMKSTHESVPYAYIQTEGLLGYIIAYLC